MNIIIAFIASAAFVGSAYAACDNTTAAKVGKCVFESDLLHTSTLAKTEAEIDSYCSANATIKCLENLMGECDADERQMNLMKSLVTPQRIMDHQIYLCDNKSAVLEGKYDCLQEFLKQPFQDCLSAAIGERVNEGEETELKTRLDDMCKFFDSYAMCFMGSDIEEGCKKFAEDAFMMAVKGFKYAYCDMDDAGKESVVNAYTVGSSSTLAASVVTVFSAFLLSVFN